MGPPLSHAQYVKQISGGFHQWDNPNSWMGSTAFINLCCKIGSHPKKNLSMVETVKVNAAGSMIHDKYTHTLVIDIYIYAIEICIFKFIYDYVMIYI